MEKNINSNNDFNPKLVKSVLVLVFCIVCLFSLAIFSYHNQPVMVVKEFIFFNTNTQVCDSLFKRIQQLDYNQVLLNSNPTCNKSFVSQIKYEFIPLGDTTMFEVNLYFPDTTMNLITHISDLIADQINEQIKSYADR